MDQPQSYGRYRVDGMVGMGGMGVVHRATDTVLNRPVALKVVSQALASSPEFRTRFGREAEALARLDSPHIIQIFDHGEQDGVPYIATQLVAGGDLDQLLRSGGPLPLAAAADIVAQVADALHDAHRIGIVHRDVKASNVLVRDPSAAEPHVYLCDFGIAKSGGDDLTAVGGVAGTSAYLSPERADGAAATPASDIYAAGCLLWTCLTGQPPFTGTEAQVVVAHHQAPIPQLLGDDEPTRLVNEVLARCLAKDPAARFADAAELRAALTALARTGATAARPAPPTPSRVASAEATTLSRDLPHAPGRRRRVLVAGLAALLVVAAAVLIGVVVWGDDDPTDPARDDPDPVVSGDVDGDGRGDVVMTQDRSDSGNPVGTLTFSSTGKSLKSAERGDQPSKGTLHEADVDGDGRLDLISEGPSAILSNELDLTVAPGNGDPSWVAKVPLDQTTFSSILVHELFQDVDNDGRADLVLDSVAKDGRTGLWVGRSNGDSFGELEQWYAGHEGWQNQEVYPGDFNGDGRGDVLVTTSAGEGQDLREDWQTYLSDGASFASSGSPYQLTDVRREIGSPLPGDVDGDGTDEMVLFGGAGKLISVFEAEDGVFTGYAVWAKGLEGEFLSDTYDSYTISDVDGDGRDDVVWLREDRTFVALISTGERLTDPEPWGELDCGEECGDRFAFAFEG